MGTRSASSKVITMQDTGQSEKKITACTACRPLRRIPAGSPAVILIGCGAAILVARPAHAAPQAITQIAGQLAVVSGTPETRNYTSSVGSTNYSITYNRNEYRLTTFQTATGTYAPLTGGYAVVRRNTATSGTYPSGDNLPSNVGWDKVSSTPTRSGTGTVADPYKYSVSSVYSKTYDDLFTSNNLWTGAENLMVNTSTNDGDARSNVERVDYILPGFQARAGLGFSVFERNANSTFKVAAITGYDSNGLPTFTNSAVLTIAAADYDVVTNANLSSFNYTVTENSVAGGDHDKVRNDNIGPQGIGGMFIAILDLVGANTTVYGYSVFGQDVLATTGAQLNSQANGALSTLFLSNSGMTDDIDLVASGAYVYQAVPEATTLVMGMVGLAPILLHRRRRRTADCDA